MGFARRLCHFAMAAQDILALRDRLKMFRIYAQWLPTEMVNNETIGYLTREKTIGEPMGKLIAGAVASKP